MLFISFLLAACDSSAEFSFHEIQSVPDKVQDAIDNEHRLQIVYEGDQTAYISFMSKGDVTADYELEDNVLTIKFEEEKQSDEEKRYVYKLTRGEATYDTIYVLVNGESVPFNLVTGIKTASLKGGN